MARHAASDAQTRERTGRDDHRLGAAVNEPDFVKARRERTGKDERGLGAGLLALGAGYLAAAFLISEPEGGYAAVGPRVFPIGIGIALVAVALSTALRARGATVAPSSGAAEAETMPAASGAPPAADSRPDAAQREARRAPAADSAPPAADSRPDAAQREAREAPADGAVPPAADWRAAAPSVLLFLAYILLLEPLGYLPATTAFIALEARLLGSRRWRRDLFAAVIVAATVYAVFSLLLGLRLPPGLLGAATGADPVSMLALPGLRLPANLPGGP